MIGQLRRLGDDERGTAAVEYTFLASLIALAMVAALSNVGTWLANSVAGVAAAFL